MVGSSVSQHGFHHTAAPRAFDLDLSSSAEGWCGISPPPPNLHVWQISPKAAAVASFSRGRVQPGLHWSSRPIWERLHPVRRWETFQTEGEVRSAGRPGGMARMSTPTWHTSCLLWHTPRMGSSSYDGCLFLELQVISDVSEAPH